ncbi:Type II toxin-antitoxin system HicB family antitoxin [Candidatus Magnetomoraceae bacterium gMMP-15]
MNVLESTRIKVKIGHFESPILHVLLTDEDDVIVARCLDFTISSHGENIKDALKALAEAVKEYILTSIEDSNLDNLYDPAHNKYWRTFNEQEARQGYIKLKSSLLKSTVISSPKELAKMTAEVSYA